MLDTFNCQEELLENSYYSFAINKCISNKSNYFNRTLLLMLQLCNSVYKSTDE